MAVANDTTRDEIITQIRTVFDPEIPVNIYDLGLIYEIRINDGGLVDVIMTLTSPNCPEAETIPPTVQGVVEKVDGIEGVKVDIVWEPAWNPEMMSEDAKLELGYM